MTKAIALFLIVVCGCAPLSPRASFEERRIQRNEEFEREARTSPAIVAAWHLKENLKKDYRELVGPSEAYDEKMDLEFSNASNEAMLTTPGRYERMAESWAKTRPDPVPTRHQIRQGIKVLDGRIKKLDVVIAKEMELAEENAKEDGEQRKKIVQVIAGIALLSLAVAAGVAAGSAASQPSYNSTSIGPYVITRTGPTTTTVLTPSHRMYTCTTSGTDRVSVVSCF